MDVFSKWLDESFASFAVPVHDNSVRDVNALQILGVMLGKREQVQRVTGQSSGICVWDETHAFFFSRVAKLQLRVGYFYSVLTKLQWSKVRHASWIITSFAMLLMYLERTTTIPLSTSVCLHSCSCPAMLDSFSSLTQKPRMIRTLLACSSVVLLMTSWWA